MATYDEIKDNEYNLSVGTYVEPEDTSEEVDIAKLNARIKIIVDKEQELREAINRLIAEIEA